MKRELWVDFAKGVAITLVVFAHAIRGVGASEVNLEPYWGVIDQRIYAFHMALFFALSGWFFIRTIVKRDLGDYLKSRFLRLLWPMLVWTYIFMGAKLLAGTLSNSPITLGDVLILPIPGILHFWFLWDLVVLSVVLYPLRYLSRNGSVPTWPLVLLCAVAIVVSLSPLQKMSGQYVDSAVANGPYFLIGVILGNMRFASRTPLAIVGCAIGFFALLAVWPASQPFEVRWLTTFGLVVLCLGFLSGSQSFVPQGVIVIGAAIGHASMSIYVMHTIFSAGFREVLLAVGIDGTWPHIIGGTAIGIIAPLVVLWVTKRVGLSTLLGLEPPARKPQTELASQT